MSRWCRLHSGGTISCNRSGSCLCVTERHIVAHALKGDQIPVTKSDKEPEARGAQKPVPKKPVISALKPVAPQSLVDQLSPTHTVPEIQR